MASPTPSFLSHSGRSAAWERERVRVRLFSCLQKTLSNVTGYPKRVACVAFERGSGGCSAHTSRHSATERLIPLHCWNPLVVGYVFPKKEADRLASNIWILSQGSGWVITCSVCLIYLWAEMRSCGKAWRSSSEKASELDEKPDALGKELELKGEGSQTHRSPTGVGRGFSQLS